MNGLLQDLYDSVSIRLKKSGFTPIAGIISVVLLMMIPVACYPPVIPISNELCGLPSIGQSPSQGVPSPGKTNHQTHQAHQEKKNLCVPGDLRGAKIRPLQEAVFSPASPTLRLQKAHILSEIRITATAIVEA